MGSRTRSFTDGEQVVITSRPHAAALAVPLVALLVVLAAAGFAAGRLPAGQWQGPGRAAVTVVAVVLVLRWSVRPWLRWLGRVLVVTDRRIVLRRGVLHRTEREVLLSRVAHVDLDRTLRQRLLGAGTLVLDAGGEWPVVARDVPHARHVASVLLDLLDDADDDDG